MLVIARTTLPGDGVVCIVLFLQSTELQLIMQSTRLFSLQDLCCCVIIKANGTGVQSALSILPCGLAPVLLRSAIRLGYNDALTQIISCWPLKEMW